MVATSWSIWKTCHVVVHARVQAGLAVGGHGVGRHGDDGQGLAGPARRGWRAWLLEAVHFGHLQVHQHQVKRVGLRAQRLQCQAAVVGHGDRRTFPSRPLATIWLILLSSASKIRTRQRRWGFSPPGVATCTGADAGNSASGKRIWK